MLFLKKLKFLLLVGENQHLLKIVPYGSHLNFTLLDLSVRHESDTQNTQDGHKKKSTRKSIESGSENILY